MSYHVHDLCETHQTAKLGDIWREGNIVFLGIEQGQM